MPSFATLTGRWVGHYRQLSQECPITAELLQVEDRLTGSMRDGSLENEFSLFELAAEIGLAPGADEQIAAQLRATAPKAGPGPVRVFTRLPQDSTVEGYRSGQLVFFVKTYRGASFSGYKVGDALLGVATENHQVHYFGQVQSDESVMEGRWWIDADRKTASLRSEGQFKLRRWVD